jgi:hypothetical protein
MKCNKPVDSVTVTLWRQEIAVKMASVWFSIQELRLHDKSGRLSLREAECLSSFIVQSENLRTVYLDLTRNEAVPLVEALSSTKVQNLTISFRGACTLQNGGRRLANALERCTSISNLRIDFLSQNAQLILLLESIPKMLGLRFFELDINYRFDKRIFDIVGQCIGGHRGEIEELKLILHDSISANPTNTSIVGLAPALRRLKVIRLHFGSRLTAWQIGELSGIVADCDNLEEFCYNLTNFEDNTSIDDFKAMCQLWSKFPSLKRLTQLCFSSVNLGREKGRFEAFLEMVKTSNTIEEVPWVQCGNDEEEAAIKRHCCNNMMHTRIELIREKGLLAAKVASSAWPLILKEFSEMPDVLYYLLQQKHGAMIGPTCHGCKRKQDFN